MSPRARAIGRSPGWYLGRAAVYALLTALLLLVLVPIVYALFGSLKSLQDLVSGGPRLLPREWRFDNYREAWKIASFSEYTWNSVFVSALSTLGITLVVTMSGYVLARFDIPGKRLLIAGLLATLFVSAGTVTIYPIFRLALRLGWTGSRWGLVLLYVFKINTANVFLYYSYIRGISPEIDQAATIDGCGTFGIYRRIILPLSTPILATLALLSFRDIWNDFLIPMVFTMSKPQIRTLTVGVVALLGNRELTSAWNIMLAGASISLLPIIVLYTVTNRYFITGLTSGAVKG